jgi:hypothetical protein
MSYESSFCSCGLLPSLHFLLLMKLFCSFAHFLTCQGIFFFLLEIVKRHILCYVQIVAPSNMRHLWWSKLLLHIAKGSLTTSIIMGYYGCLNVCHLFLLKYDISTFHAFWHKGKALLPHKNCNVVRKLNNAVYYCFENKQHY